MNGWIIRCYFITALLTQDRNSDVTIENKMKSLGDTYFLGKESEGRTLYADLGFNEPFL